MSALYWRPVLLFCARCSRECDSPEQVAQRSTIAQAGAASLLGAAYDTLHQSTPVWNRQRESLAEMDGLLGLAVMREPGSGRHSAEYDSYVLYRPSNDVLSAASGAVALLDLCGTPRGMAALLQELQSRYDKLQINSEADHSPALPCLRHAGFKVTHERLHMVTALTDSADVDELRNAVMRPLASSKL